MAIRNFVSYVILMKNEFVQHHCSLTMCVTFVSPLSILWPQTRLLSLIRWHDILWYDRSYIIKICIWYQISYWIVGIIWYGDVTSYITEMMIWYDIWYDYTDYFLHSNRHHVCPGICHMYSTCTSIAICFALSYDSWALIVLPDDLRVLSEILPSYHMKQHIVEEI